MVIIGLDPHTKTHTAVALNSQGKELGTLTIPNNSEGYSQLHAWAEQFDERRWAIEGVNHPFIRAFSQPLAQREWVINIPASLTSQYRSRRGTKKNDHIDAANAARAYLANPQLPRYGSHPVLQELKELSRTREQLARNLRALKQVRAKLATDSPARAPLNAAITCLEQQVKALDESCEARIKQHVPWLLELHGVGVVHAATLLAEVDDVKRFPSKDAFANYCGCAPVERASGGCRRAQVNAAGNRRLNRTLHMMAVLRLKTRTRTRAYFDRKLQEGKTKRAALRCLKTYIAREVYTFMTTTPGWSLLAQPQSS